MAADILLALELDNTPEFLTWWACQDREFDLVFDNLEKIFQTDETYKHDRLYKFMIRYWKEQINKTDIITFCEFSNCLSMVSFEESEIYLMLEYCLNSDGIDQLLSEYGYEKKNCTTETNTIGNCQS